MTIERLSENPVLPFDRDAVLKGGMPLTKYFHQLVETLQTEYLYKIIYYINHLPQTMTWNGGDNCDATHPVTINFKIPSEMTEITSVKLSFEIGPFRTDSTGAASGGGATSSSGGGTTVTSADGGAQTSSSGGGQTTSAGGAQTSSSGGAQTSSSGGGATVTSASGGDSTTSAYGASISTQTATAGGGSDDTSSEDGTGFHTHSWEEVYPGHSHPISDFSHSHTAPAHTHSVTVADHTHTVSDHTHTVANHTHTVADHTHTVADHNHAVTVAAHTHTVPDHTHALMFGIYEETNAATVYFNVDNGSGFGLPSANYTDDQLDIDITSQITTVGRKAVRFSTDLRCYIAVELEVKVKVKAE